MKSLLILLFSAALGLLVSASAAGPTTALDTRPAGVVRRVYDVSELLAAAAARPEPSNLLTPRQLISGELTEPIPPVYPSYYPNPPPDPIAQAGKNLMGLVKAQVDPGGWAKPDSGPKSIDLYAGRLVVNQTPENQSAVADLLGALRMPDTIGRPMTLEADWLLLAPGELEKLLVAAPRGEGADEIDPAALAKLPASVFYARARTTAIDGNSMQIVAGRSRDVIVASDVGLTDGGVVNHPEPVRQLSGAALRTTPRLRGDVAWVNVTSFVSDWSPLDPAGDRPVPAPTTRPTEASMAPVIDRVNLPMQQLVTSARLPLGKLLVIGGMTVEPDVNGAPPGDPLAKDGRQIYLLLRVTLP